MFCLIIKQVEVLKCRTAQYTHMAHIQKQGIKTVITGFCSAFLYALPIVSFIHCKANSFLI